jgi:hypothetical protein
VALAVLRLRGAADGRVLLDAELGSNRWYTWAVGDEEVRVMHGVHMLGNPVHTAPLTGPLPEHALGRTLVAIPAELLDRERRYVQLLTYRTAERDGPAVSEIVKIPPGSGARMGEIPDIAFGMDAKMMSHTESLPVAFAYREHRPEFSEALFIEAIVGAIGPALSMLGPMLAQHAAPRPAGAPRTATGGPNTQEILQLVQLVLQQVQAAQGAGGRGGQAVAVHGGDGSGGNGSGGGYGAGASGNAATAQALALDRGIDSRYASATAAPLLAALPALIPLLQQVLTPETVQSIIGAVDPKNVIGAVSDGITKVGRLAGDIHQAEMDHLRQLNPGVDDPALDQLLAGLSLSRGSGFSRSRGAHRADAGPRYTRTTAVKLDFADMTPHMLQGRTRVCYRAGRDLEFPLTLETTRAVRDARLFLVVSEAGTQRVVVRRRLEVPEAAAGRIPVTPGLSVAESATLRPGVEHLVTAHLCWRTRAGKKLGTSITQLVTIIGELMYGRTGEGGPLVPLNDVERHRDYWHKVWQGTFTSAMRSVDFDCKYYMALEPDRDRNARMEAVVRAAQHGTWKQRGRMRSGMILSPAALNALLPQLDRPSLGEDELAALRAPEFVDRFNQAARFKVAMRGRDGTSAALWVFPELRIAEVVLHRATEVDEHGQVRAFAEHTVQFPMPALIHYIGARTAQ